MRTRYRERRHACWVCGGTMDVAQACTVACTSHFLIASGYGRTACPDRCHWLHDVDPRGQHVLYVNRDTNRRQVGMVVQHKASVALVVCPVYDSADVTDSCMPLEPPNSITWKPETTRLRGLDPPPATRELDLDECFFFVPAPPPPPPPAAADGAAADRTRARP